MKLSTNLIPVVRSPIFVDLDQGQVFCQHNVIFMKTEKREDTVCNAIRLSDGFFFAFASYDQVTPLKVILKKDE